MNNVTVVVPVYKDWSTLSKCIEALKMYLSEKHTVMLVNDMGPDWEQLEGNMLSAIKGYGNFIYRKNETNAGFVKTCNRAVMEWDAGNNDILLLNSDTEVTEGFLEEMQKILYLDSKTGVVCPRSNNATFLSVPVNNNGKYVSAEESYQIYQQVRNFLPEWEECWTGVGFAFLIKRQVIREAGLFDEVYGRGYNEENDFCMRIRKQGYQIMKANHAYVFHMGRVSFQDETEELDLRNGSVLLKRYPYYWEKVKEFERKVDVIDYYADILTDVIYDKRRVLIVLLRDMDRGKLAEMITQCRDSETLRRCDYQIVASKNNVKAIRRQFKGTVVCSRLENIKGTFHIAYGLSEPDEGERLVLDRHSPITAVVEDFTGLDIEDDVGRLMELRDSDVCGLREKWQSNLKKEEAGRDRGMGREKRIRKVKDYLYRNHIWTYILWRGMKKRLVLGRGKRGNTTPV